MPRRKLLTSLANDIERAVQQARTEATKEIVLNLQKKGPWWTGTFSKSWVVSNYPVKGGLIDREPNPPWWDEKAIQAARRPRETQRPEFPVVNINQTLYIGNASKHGLFATGYWGKKIHHHEAILDIEGKEVTYAQHGQTRQLTANIFPQASWYRIYLNNPEYLMRDINRGFRSKNFVIRKGNRDASWRNKNYTGNIGLSGGSYKYTPKSYLDL